MAHLSKKKKKKKKIVYIFAGPWTPCLICWFLMFICCTISYWQPCVNLDCTSVQMLQEQITWSKILTSETNRYIFYKILIIICIVPRFFHMSSTCWRIGALGPQNWNSWLEHCKQRFSVVFFRQQHCGQLETLWLEQMNKHRLCLVVMLYLISPHYWHIQRKKLTR